MADPSDKERLDALDQRIRAAKGEREPKPREPEHYSQAQVAWRMVTELVAGLGIGVAVGLGLDSVLGTRPWMLIVFVLLGFAAGVRVMLRTAGEIGKDLAEPSAKDEGE